MSTPADEPRGGRRGRPAAADDAEPPAPIWARPEPPGRGRHGGLSRAQIVTAALALADAEGLDAVTMRRLGTELRAGAMSLYHYFQSRDELLDLMGDTVAAEMLVPGELPSDWRAALEAIVHRSREAFLRHPWLLITLQERPRVSPNMLRHVEQSSQAVAGLHERGVAPELLSAIVYAADDYMLGFTLRELSDLPRGGTPGVAGEFRQQAEDPYVRYLLESGEFPILGAFLAQGGQPTPPDFETGLGWLLDGFAARLGL